MGKLLMLITVLMALLMGCAPRAAYVTPDDMAKLRTDIGSELNGLYDSLKNENKRHEKSIDKKLDDCICPNRMK